MTPKEKEREIIATEINEVRCAKCNNIIDLSERDERIRQKAFQSQKPKLKEDIEKLRSKLELLERYLDDLIEKTSYQVNISEHSVDMRKLIKESKELLKSLDDEK